MPGMVHNIRIVFGAQTQPSITIQQSDYNSRKIQAACFTSSGQPMDFSGATVTVVYNAGADPTKEYPVTVVGNVLAFTMPGLAAQTAGSWTMQIFIYVSDSLLHSAEIPYTVRKTITPGTGGDDPVPALVLLIQQTQDAIGECNKATENANKTVVVAGGCYFLGGFGRLFSTPELVAANGYDSIVPTMLEGLSTVLIAVVVVLVLSASMSTLSSLVLASSSTLTLDFIKDTSNMSRLAPAQEAHGAVVNAQAVAGFEHLHQGLVAVHFQHLAGTLFAVGLGDLHQLVIGDPGDAFHQHQGAHHLFDGMVFLQHQACPP